MMLKNPLSIGGIDNTPGLLTDETSLSSLRAEIKNRILWLIDQAEPR